MKRSLLTICVSLIFTILSIEQVLSNIKVPLFQDDYSEDDLSNLFANKSRTGQDCEDCSEDLSVYTGKYPVTTETYDDYSGDGPTTLNITSTTHQPNNPSYVEDCPHERYCKADLSECGRFYQCAAKMWIVRRCNSGFKFNKQNCECELEENWGEGCAGHGVQEESSNTSFIVLWIFLSFLIVTFLILLFFALSCEVTIMRHPLLRKTRPSSYYEKDDF